MSTSLAYHTQGIIGFQHKSFDFSEKKVIQCLEKTEHRCPKCFNLSVSAYPIRERQIQAMPYGSKQTYFKVTIHRIYCPKCKKELADLHMMKESLRSIYSVADNPLEAELSLEKRCKQSLSLDSAYPGKMVKCLRQHWEGILGFWKYDNLTNAGMEGFNNKVRTMIRQAYGFRDEEYMRLKIFDFPNKRVNDGI